MKESFQSSNVVYSDVPNNCTGKNKNTYSVKKSLQLVITLYAGKILQIEKNFWDNFAFLFDYKMIKCTFFFEFGYFHC